MAPDLDIKTCRLIGRALKKMDFAQLIHPCDFNSIGAHNPFCDAQTVYAFPSVMASGTHAERCAAVCSSLQLNCELWPSEGYTSGDLLEARAENLSRVKDCLRSLEACAEKTSFGCFLGSIIAVFSCKGALSC